MADLVDKIPPPEALESAARLSSQTLRVLRRLEPLREVHHLRDPLWARRQTSSTYFGRPVRPFGLAFLLLLVTFRSIVIPIKALILNLLSVGAAYGVLVLIFQQGHLQSLLGFKSIGGVIDWLPLFLFVILFSKAGAGIKRARQRSPTLAGAGWLRVSSRLPRSP